MRENFGWLPRLTSFAGSFFTIEPLANTTADLAGSTRIRDGWFYPPLEPEFASLGSAEPLVYSNWFALPSTHSLWFDREDESLTDLAAFTVETLGILEGMQLLLEGWGHFYRTPAKVSLLGDIQSVRPSAISRILDRAIEFWRTNPRTRKNMYGAIHWHTFGCSYEHDFEQFSTAYMVLDTCWAVHKQLGRTSARGHAERLPAMCDHYDIPTPTWAIVSSGKSRLSELRNDYVHEGLWAGQPIGFSYPKDVPGIHLELFWFNTRLILAILGERSAYTRSLPDYQPWVVD